MPDKERLEAYDKALNGIFDHEVAERIFQRNKNKMNEAELNAQMALLKEFQILNSRPVPREFPIKRDAFNTAIPDAEKVDQIVNTLPNTIKDFSQASKNYAAILLMNNSANIETLTTLKDTLQHMNDFIGSSSPSPSGKVDVAVMVEATKGLLTSGERLLTNVDKFLTRTSQNTALTETSEQAKQFRKCANAMRFNIYSIAATAMVIAGLCLTLSGVGAAVGMPLMGFGIGMHIGNFLTLGLDALNEKSIAKQAQPMRQNMAAGANLIKDTAKLQFTLQNPTADKNTKGMRVDINNNRQVEIRDGNDARSIHRGPKR